MVLLLEEKMPKADEVAKERLRESEVGSPKSEVRSHLRGKMAES
jgi:hypothetical protein